MCNWFDNYDMLQLNHCNVNQSNIFNLIDIAIKIAYTNLQRENLFKNVSYPLGSILVSKDNICGKYAYH